MKNTSKKVQTFFDGYAENFDSLYGHTGKRGKIGRWLDRKFRKVMRDRFEVTLKYTAADDIHTILDVGCGPGRYCREFLKQGKQVVGMDLADRMLKLAQKAVADVRSDESISFMNGDYFVIQFDTKFDAACLMGFFDYINDPAVLFEKLKKEINKEIYASFPKKSGILAKIRRVRYLLRNCPLYLYSRKDIDELMKKVNLHDRYQVLDLDRDYFVRVDLRS